MPRLENKVALVTGASGGIGRATAVELARRGASVAVHYFKNERGAAETADEVRAVGARVEVLAGDLTRGEQARKVLAGVAGAFGRLDVLVNNAGDMIERRPLLEMDAEMWQRVFDTNVTSTFYCTQLAAPGMIDRRSGVIVNLSSLAAAAGTTGGAGAATGVAQAGSSAAAGGGGGVSTTALVIGGVAVVGAAGAGAAIVASQGDKTCDFTITVADRSATTIGIRWTPNAGAYQDTYVVDGAPANACVEPPVHDRGAVATGGVFTITGLTPSTSYQIHIHSADVTCPQCDSGFNLTSGQGYASVVVTTSAAGAGSQPLTAHDYQSGCGR